MAADSLEARIRKLEVLVFHPSRYCTGVLATSDSDGAEGHEGYARMCAELERLYRMRETQAAEKWRELAPIEGRRLSSGHLPRPEPRDPDLRAHDYDPYDERSQDWRHDHA